MQDHPRSINRHAGPDARRPSSLAASLLALLAAVGCGDRADPVAPESPEPSRPSFAPGGAVQYSMRRLPLLPGEYIGEAKDINDAGVIVGSSFGPGTSLQAVMWKGGSVMSLGVPNPSIAEGIGRSGIVVGVFKIGTVHNAFRWTSASGTDTLPSLAGLDTWAYAVNGAGTAVGFSNTATTHSAVMWSSRGGITNLHPPWASGSVANDINEDGWIAGSAWDARTGVRRAVLWAPDLSVIKLGHLGSVDNEALGLNDLEQSVGWAALGPEPSPSGYLRRRAAFWRPPPIPLGHALGTKCPTLSVAPAISNLGRIVGNCSVHDAWTIRNGSFEFLPGSLDAKAEAVNSCGIVVGHIDEPPSSPTKVSPVVWTRVNTTGPSGSPICDQ